MTVSTVDTNALLSVTVVTKMPSPYQVELFDEIARQQGCNLRIVYLELSDGHHPWDMPEMGHEHCSLQGVSADWSTAWKWCAEADLTVFNFYTNTFSMAAIYARAISGRPWAFWGERPGYLKLGRMAKTTRRVFLQPLQSKAVPIWGVGEYALEAYRAEWGQEKTYYNLPYFSDLSRFTSLRKPTTEHSELVILYSGLLNTRKDVMTLARAFLALAQEHPHVRLNVLGTGPLEKSMRAVLAPVGDRVSWMGFRPWDELPSLYGQADLFCLPSLHDGWGMVVVEALAAGLPVATTQTTGAAIEFVKDGENGWLIPPGDEKALLSALRDAATAPKTKILAMKEAARKSVAGHSLAEGARRFRQTAAASLANANCRLLPPAGERPHDSRLPNTHVLLAGNYLPDGQPSMHRYADLVSRCLDEHGIPRTLARPPVVLKTPGLPKFLSTMAGYIDKFLIFPLLLRWKASRKAQNANLLIHLLDQGNALYLPWVRDFTVVATCHDLIAIRAALGEIDSVGPPAHGPWIQESILKALGLARMILCVSEKTRSDCERLLPKPTPTLKCVPNPLDPSFVKHEESAGSAGCAVPLPDHFLLHVGNSSWYKNRMGLLQIYSELRRMGGDISPLVLMGHPLKDRELELIQELELSAHCISIPKPSDEEVKAAYRKAEALIFPSLIEGFGWPILEAMACGCPVFTSNRSPMTEVGGTAAEYFDPDTPKQAAQLIAQRLYREPSWRSNRINAGLEHVKLFSFERFSESMIEAYCVAVSQLHPFRVC